jgi:hypothetical protein
MTAATSSRDRDDVTDAPFDTAVDPSVRRSGFDWPRTVLVLATVVPIVVAVTRALRTDWIPVGDNGLLAVRVGDVLTTHHPWLGSWTSASLSLGIDVNNPGATYQYLVAPFVWAFGPVAGIAIGVAAINVACVVGVSVASRRIGGWAMERWMLVAAAVLAWSMGSELLFDLWQPHAMLLPVLLVLVLCTGLATGRMWCLPLLAVTSSVIVQNHLGHAMVLAAVIVAACVMAVVARRPAVLEQLRAGARSPTAVWTVIGVVVVWLPSLIEQFTADGEGNLSRLASASTGDADQVGLATATRIVAAVVALPPWISRTGFADTIESTPVTTGPDGTSVDIAGLPSGVTAALAIAALVAILVVLAHRSRPAARAGAVLAVVGVAGSVVALSQVVIGPIGFAAHHARWTFAVGAYVIAVVAWCVTGLVTQRRHRVDRVDQVDRVATALAIGVGVVAMAANLPRFAHDQGPVADRAATSSLRRTYADMERIDPSVVGTIRYDTDVLRPFEPYSGAIMLRLEQLGIEFRVEDEGWVRQLGEGRRADGDERWSLVQYQTTDAVALAPDACVVSIRSELDPEGEATARDTARRLAGALVAGDVVVDVATLPDDLASRVSTALGGDVDAAERLVTDGWIAAWIDDGTATTIAPLTVAAVRRDLADVARWVETSFALVLVAADETVSVDGSPGRRCPIG